MSAMICVSLPKIAWPVWQYGHHSESLKALRRRTSVSEVLMPLCTVLLWSDSDRSANPPPLGSESTKNDSTSRRRASRGVNDTC
jgi:hypothetical protein